MTVVSHITSVQQSQGSAEEKNIFGVAISDLSRDSALSTLVEAIAARRHCKLAFCNAHTANIAWGDKDFRLVLQGFTVFADGIGVDVAAKVLYGAPFAANLNGTDFIPALLRAVTTPLRIALIGGKAGVADAAAQQITQQTLQHQISHVMHGFENDQNTQTFLHALEASPVDILLVAMGNPKQEFWIAQNIDAQHATLVVGVGALFDFLTGEVSRAPNWVREIRLEWLYRLAQEPTRLFKRYVFGNPLFLVRVAFMKLGLKRFPC